MTETMREFVRSGHPDGGIADLPLRNRDEVAASTCSKQLEARRIDNLFVEGIA